MDTIMHRTLAQPCWKLLRCPIYIRPLSAPNHAYYCYTVPKYTNPSQTAVQLFFLTEALKGIKHQNRWLVCLAAESHKPKQLGQPVVV